MGGETSVVKHVANSDLAQLGRLFPLDLELFPLFRSNPAAMANEDCASIYL